MCLRSEKRNAYKGEIIIQYEPISEFQQLIYGHNQIMIIRVYFPLTTCLCPVVGVLHEPYSAKPAQRSSYTGPPGYIGWTRFQYVDWRACTATPLSGFS